MTTSPDVVVCLKWVTHPGEPDDERFAGMSLADQAALELALQQAAALHTTVTAITVGPASADRVLRDALACGAGHAIRIDAPPATTGVDVAVAIVGQIATARFVWCGDYSIDRGTGSVPVFLAAYLHAEQALGVIAVELTGAELHATRRLDGGRRELLRLDAPAVVSVEGATAQLRRAGLAALRAARATTIRVVQPTTPMRPEERVVRPYRPRARELAPPQGASALERLRVLTDASGDPARGETVHLEPAAAAARIVAALRHWGYLGANP